MFFHVQNPPRLVDSLVLMVVHLNEIKWRSRLSTLEQLQPFNSGIQLEVDGAIPIHSVMSIAEGIIKVRRNQTYRSGPIHHRHDEKEAERIVVEGLIRLGMEEDELADPPGSDPTKLAIATDVRANTAVPMAWIAERLQMRSAANVSQQLRRFRPKGMIVP
jgi:hypothetical protein